MPPTKTIALLALALVAAVAEAAVKFGGGYLTPELSGSTEFTTNAQSRADGSEDFILSLTPALSYQSVGSTYGIEVRGGLSFQRYAELDENDSEDLDLSASLSYPNGLSLPYSYSISAAVSENTSANSEFGEVTRDRRYTASASGNYRVSRLYTLGSGLDYSKTVPISGDRSETTSFGIPITIDYRYSELLSYGAGYRFRVQDSEGGSNGDSSTDHAVFARATGQLYPLVQADLQLGAQIRMPEEGGSEVGPYASGGLTWQASSLTSVGLQLSADFETSTAGRSSRNYSIQSNLSHALQSNLDVSLTAGLSLREFSGQGGGVADERSDTEWQLGAGLGTTVYEHTNLSLALRYRNNSSDEARSDYDEASLRISASRPF